MTMPTTHLWVRAECRDNEQRVGVTPQGVAQLIDAGLQVTVEESPSRIIGIDGFEAAGAEIAAEGSWRDAPLDAIVFGLKELPDDGSPLRHRHIMFGHAYKGQSAGQKLLARFREGGGTLYDLEYLVDESGRRVAAFGYWAGYAGAAVSLFGWAAQTQGQTCPAMSTWPDAKAMCTQLSNEMQKTGQAAPTALVIGALGRVGTGAADLCRQMGVSVTGWDMQETAHGGPFPEILQHELFFNCILAQSGCPVFVPKGSETAHRNLRVIGDIACDPDSAYNPVPVYDRATTWAEPVIRVHEQPPLDVMAIDNLPSLLPLESSEDFAGQLLSHLKTLGSLQSGVWGRAHQIFETHVSQLNAGAN